mgnify:CR=1 FL=1
MLTVNMQILIKEYYTRRSFYMKDKYKSKIIISISGAVIGAVCTYFEGKSNGAQQQNEISCI